MHSIFQTQWKTTPVTRDMPQNGTNKGLKLGSLPGKLPTPPQLKPNSRSECQILNEATLVTQRTTPFGATCLELRKNVC